MHLLKILIAQRVSQIPPHAQDDDLAPEMSPSEHCRPAVAHSYHPIRPASNRFCDTTLYCGPSVAFLGDSGVLPATSRAGHACPCVASPFSAETETVRVSQRYRQAFRVQSWISVHALLSARSGHSIPRLCALQAGCPGVSAKQGISIIKRRMHFCDKDRISLSMILS